MILTRAFDDQPIPYTTVYGVTLIAILRLGLLGAMRAKAYHKFVSLPLYLDMAPWNIVFVGVRAGAVRLRRCVPHVTHARGAQPALDYIDFDTRDHTYDEAVPLVRALRVRASSWRANDVGGV